MNLGAILRSAGYFGISGVIASAKNSYVWLFAFDIKYCTP